VKETGDSDAMLRHGDGFGGKGHTMMDSMNRRFQNRIKTTSVSNSLYEVGNITLGTKIYFDVLEHRTMVTLISLGQLRTRENS
jgi:hypothetical protein